MAAIPAPTLTPREEWPDADFDIPDGVPLHAHAQFGKDDNEDEDWDAEMDLGDPARSNVKPLVANPPSKLVNISADISAQMFTIRPPLQTVDAEDDDDDDGVSTIKGTAFPILNPSKPSSSTLASSSIDEDFEDAFSLPSDLTQLSLAPMSLNHRSSKNSLEWGDKDQTSSSQSSDAYSTLGFADASPSSNSASSASSICLPDTESEHDGEDDDLEGVIIPTALFESGQGGRQLTKILEQKKKAQFTSNQVKVVCPDPEDDFEMGLVFDDDVDLTPSRLLQKPQRLFNRSNSVPIPRSAALRPPPRYKTERAKSPNNPPQSSVRQLSKLRLSPSPPLRPPSRSQTFQALGSATQTPTPSPSPSSSFLAPKPGSLRGQKSHSGLKPVSPPSTSRILTRKASLSSLIESNQPQASGSGTPGPRRYDEPTAASRAKTQRSSTSRIQDFKVPPTRPSTPSSNPVALRLTMPNQSRLKSRPALSQLFGTTNPPPLPVPASSMRTVSPPTLPRPPSSLSLKGAPRLPKNPPSAPKLLRRPKRQRTFGDGSELDGIEDLPTDREKEGRFRVQPKGYGNRVPGATYGSKSPDKSLEKVTLRRKGKTEDINDEAFNALAPATNTLRRTARIDFPSKVSPSFPDSFSKKRKQNVPSPTGPTKRKPTLIRNLGGAGGPKVIGDMKWNPQSLRWEGNDHVLRDFDAVIGTSTRPALITHLTGSSIGSPVGPFASGARIVGNMMFDPSRMCWISTLPAEEDEPDVFANLADDEEDEDWEAKGGTIRASVQQRVSDVGIEPKLTLPSASPSPARSHTRTLSESGSDRGSRASMVVCDVDEEFLASCRLAEERHRMEMKGWRSALAKQDVFSTSDRSHLYEIRALATRKY